MRTKLLLADLPRQCTKTQKLRDGRPLLGAQRTGPRLLRRLGNGLPPTILDEGDNAISHE
jgi:hypothetical protein